MNRRMLMSKYEQIKTDISDISQLTKKLAKDDPRRIIHSIKVGIAITLVSLFYYFDLLYQGFGVNAMWAVLTVVVVFEFSVGATLGKGVNRVLATIVGGMSGFGAHKLATLSSGVYNKLLEPFLLGLFVFITAGIMTFMRFFPKMKARFDYGLLVFILTFCLICVSGYRNEEVIDMAHRRISTILIGSSTAVIVCILISPVWAGTDLHNLVSSNILTLSLFFQGFGVEYFNTSSDITSDDDYKSSINAIKNVLDSKHNIDTLLNYAKWEFRHGRFKYGHPWIQYQKIGELARHCACRAEALHGFLYSQVQAPNEVKAKFRDPCMKISTESGNALNELSIAIKKMTKPSKAQPHLQKAKQAAENLSLIMLKSNIWNNLSLSDVTSVATVANLLADVVACTEDIAEAVQELASLAKFKDANKDVNKVSSQIDEKTKLTNQGSIKRRCVANHVVSIETSSPTSSPRISVPKDPPSLAMAQNNAE